MSKAERMAAKKFKERNRTPRRHLKAEAMNIFEMLSNFPGLVAVKLPKSETWNDVEEKLMNSGLFPLLCMSKDSMFFSNLEAMHIKHCSKNQVNFVVPSTPSTPDSKIKNKVPGAPKKRQV